MNWTLSGIFAGPWRIRTVLVWLMLTCLIPGIVGVSILFVQEYQLRRSQLERDTLAMARALVQSVDSRLVRALTAVQGLAAYGAPEPSALASYHALAKREIEATGAGMNFVLSDRSGQQLVNTLRNIGEPLPLHGNPKNLERLFVSGKPVISNLYVGGVLKKPVLSVEVPISKDGRVVYGLAIGLLPMDFSTILAAQKLPEGWVGAIFDSR